MAPTLLAGEFVVVDRHAYRNASPSVGDIVLAPDPREPQRMLVKRVIECDPAAGAWLEGDNPGASTDSRHFGPLPADGIMGRVRWRYWPVRRIGRVR